MFTVRPLLVDDLPQGLELSCSAGWNQTPHDWSRIHRLGAGGCYCACVGQQIVGTVATCRFDQVGWISMMLVADAWRRQGIGQSLLSHAIEHLEADGATSIRLDATPAGEPLYRKFGFAEQFVLHRYGGIAQGEDANEGARSIEERHLDSLVAVDRQIVGYDRRPLLAALLADSSRTLYLEHDSTCAAYAMSRPGLRAEFVGPCLGESHSDGLRLLASLFEALRGKAVYVDIPEANEAAVQTAIAHGLRHERPLLRMSRGRPCIERVNHLFASSGPEMG